MLRCPCDSDAYPRTHRRLRAHTERRSILKTEEHRKERAAQDDEDVHDEQPHREGAYGDHTPASADPDASILPVLLAWNALCAPPFAHVDAEPGPGLSVRGVRVGRAALVDARLWAGLWG